MHGVTFCWRHTASQILRQANEPIQLGRLVRGVLRSQPIDGRFELAVLGELEIALVLVVHAADDVGTYRADRIRHTLPRHHPHPAAILVHHRIDAHRSRHQELVRRLTELRGLGESRGRIAVEQIEHEPLEATHVLLEAIVRSLLLFLGQHQSSSGTSKPASRSSSIVTPGS